MEKCWAQLPEDRPDFEEICKTLEGIDEKKGDSFKTE